MDPSEIPDTTPIRLTWELEVNAPIGKAWAALSDTDRFNRAASLSFRFEEFPQEDGTTKRVGRARRLGVIDLVWDELPFQYRSGEWFQVVRNLRSGPATQMRTRCRLRPSEEGTSLRYSVEIYPRSAIYRPLIALEAYAFTRPKLERALFAILDELEGAEIRVDPLPPPLSSEADTFLKGALEKVRDPTVREALDEFIRKAPLVEQDRILPLRWAATRDLDEDVALRGLLDGVRGGILTLSWELICPSCLSPKHRVEALADVSRKVHCPSCNIHYDGTFPDSLSVNLRTSEALRQFEVEIECIGSPAAQRHVVAQEVLPPGETITFAMNYKAGSYRLRTWPPIDTAALEVRAEADKEIEETAAQEDGFAPFRLGLNPGQGSLSVSSSLGREMKVILERRQRPEGILTASKLLELEDVSDVLPLEALRPDIRTLARLQFVVAAETIYQDSARLETLEEALLPYQPRHIRWGDRWILGTFDELEHGLKAAQALLGRAEVYCSVTSGMVLDVTVGDEDVPIGRALDEAMSLLMQSRPGLIAVPTSLLESPSAVGMVEKTDLIRLDALDGAADASSISWLAG